MKDYKILLEWIYSIMLIGMTIGWAYLMLVLLLTKQIYLMGISIIVFAWLMVFMLENNL